MVELPLFPLNMVLFPGMPVQLHIFEERYKQMINHCIESQSPFGIVLIDHGQQENGPLAHPYSVGTSANITQVQRLPHGRMNILAIGKDRFKINAINTTRPFLMSDVDYVPYEQERKTALRRHFRRLSPLFTRYISTLKQSGQFTFDETQLPSEPLSHAYLSAFLLQTEPYEKQQLLELDTISELYESLIDIYRREIPLIDTLMSPPDFADDSTVFTPN